MNKTKQILLFMVAIAAHACELAKPTPPPVLPEKEEKEAEKPPHIRLEFPDPDFTWKQAFRKKTWLEHPNAVYFEHKSEILALYKLWLAKSRTVTRLTKKAGAYGLPDSGILYEYLELPSLEGKENRALALWIEKPGIVFHEPGAAGCAGELEGLGKISGFRRLLLLDTKQHRILQQIDSLPHNGFQEWLYAPYASMDFKPMQALHLRDIDGDGHKAELLFCAYAACYVYDCTILAYDATPDKLVQRPIQLNITVPFRDEAKPDTTYLKETNWVMDFPLKAIGPKGHIRYSRDPGHASPVTLHYDFQYDPMEKRFKGTLVYRRIN